jgi:hypothetical protein
MLAHQAVLVLSTDRGSKFGNDVAKSRAFGVVRLSLLF